MNLKDTRILFFLPALAASAPHAFAAAPAFCTYNPVSDKYACHETLTSEEELSCRAKAGRSVLGKILPSDLAGCNTSKFPLLNWSIDEDEITSVAIIPPAAPKYAPHAKTGVNYKAANINIHYAIGGGAPQYTTCFAQDRGAYLCDLSPAFDDIDCRKTADNGVKLSAHFDGVYARPGAPGKPFTSGPVSFNYTKLFRHLCAAKQQIATTRETVKEIRPPE